MSISLNQGFVNETLDHCLEDLVVRFVLNCPDEDLASYERVLFQIEEANWFYLDYVTPLNPLLQPKKMKPFTRSIVKLCPVVWKWGDPDIALASFGKYKATIPVRGAALINKSMDKLLLVKGIESNSWGFPRGKISKDEKDVDCAVRELEEETGFDASELIDEDLYVERTLKGKNYKIYIIKNVPEETVFEPKAKFEIVDIKWHSLKQLNKSLKSNSGHFFLVNSMIKPIMSHINSWKNSDVAHLKSVATIQLKKLLGIGQQEEKKDPGRELLSFIQNAARNRTAKVTSGEDGSEATAPTTATSGTEATNSTTQTPVTLPPMSLPPLPFSIPPFMNSPFFPPPPMRVPGFMVPHLPYGMVPPHIIHARMQQQQQQQQQRGMLSSGMIVQNAPSASSLAKPKFRSSVSNTKELLSMLSRGGKSPAVKTNQLNISQQPQQPGSPMIHSGNMLKREDSNASQLMSILKRPATTTTAVSNTESPDSRQMSTASSTKTEFPTSTRGDITPLGLATPLSNTVDSSSSKLLNILKKQPVESSPRQQDANQLLNILKNSTNQQQQQQQQQSPNTTSNGFAQLLNILKKPATPLSAEEQNQEQVKEKPKNDSPNNSAQLLNLLKKSSTPQPPVSATDSQAESSNQLLNLLKKPSTPEPSTPVAPSNGSKLLNILKKPSSTLHATEKLAEEPNQSVNPPQPSATSTTQATTTTPNGLTGLLNILKKSNDSESNPESLPATATPAPNPSEKSRELMNLLSKSANNNNVNPPVRILKRQASTDSNKSNPNDSTKLLNILKRDPTPTHNNNNNSNYNNNINNMNTPVDQGKKLLTILKRPQTSSASPQQSQPKVNILKRPASASSTTDMKNNDNGSSQLLSMLKKPLAPQPKVENEPVKTVTPVPISNITSTLIAPPMNEEDPSKSLLNLLQKSKKESETPIEQSETSEPINVEQTEETDSDEEYDEARDLEYDDFEDFEDDSDEGTNIAFDDDDDNDN